MTETIQESKLAAFTENLKPSTLSLPSTILNEAKSIISSIDFPTTRTEAWKYTRVGKIAGIRANNKETAIKSDSNPDFSIVPNAITLVFENGQFVGDLSKINLPKGLSIKTLESCTREELSKIGSLTRLENDVFSSINTVYSQTGYFIVIDEKIEIDQPIQIIHIVSDSSLVLNYRNFIHVKKFSKAHLVTAYISKNISESFSNVLTEIKVDENAFLTVDKIQNEENIYQVNTENVWQDKDSTFTINTITLNGGLVRNNLYIAVAGVNCTTNLNGAYLLKENQHVDNHTYVDHIAPHCESNELYKGVMADKSTAVFNGKVMVRKDSQKINAFQSNGNVLMSENATVYSKPELEIYADDVKCSHGSTTGQLDEEAIFYLRARGLSEKSARNLMVSAFIGDVLSKLENENVVNYVHSILQERFGWEF